MKLTPDDVRQAIMAVVLDTRPGDELDYRRVADLLNGKLGVLAPLSGKHHRPEVLH